MSAGNKDNGLMEAIAVAALLFLFWKFLRKREQEGIKQAEPPTTPAEFDLNKVCDKIIYEPLSTNDLRQSNLYGPGWCYRGDRSVIDEKAGFGDQYSEKQADDYQQMKQEEAIRIMNKSYIQFRLINNTAAAIDMDVLNTTQSSEPFNPTPDIPVIGLATGITNSGFNANWSESNGAGGYYLDVATDSGFLSMVSGFNNKNVGNVFTYAVSGLSGGTTYYFRVRAYSGSSASESSDSESAITIPDAPVAASGTDMTTTQFTANWGGVTGATGYYLDVATDSGFTSFVTGFQNKNVNNVTDYYVTGLIAGTNYYYRIRAYNSTGTSSNSNVITSPTNEDVVDGDGNHYTYITVGSLKWLVENLKTKKYNDGTAISEITDNGYADWFLPSKDELGAMYTELHLYGVGGFSNVQYWTSTEAWWDTTAAYHRSFLTGGEAATIKTDTTNNHVRACRSFNGSAGDYSLRDTGPAGGLIFAFSGGKYYEAAPSDYALVYKWSNITTAIGASAQGTAIGTGITNTAAIIGQAGHTDSAAKICNDLTVGGWISDTTGAMCFYNNDEATYKADYGALYNWYAVNNAHGLAPTGWRIPTQADWEALFNVLIPNVGGKLKETGTTYWNSPNTGATDEIGFKARGAGERSYNDGSFADIKVYTNYWSSEASGLYYFLQYNESDYYDAITSKKWGFSVRCVKDV